MTPAMTTDQLIDRYGLPAGYQRVMWADVVNGQEVWLYGTHNGAGTAYGPHTIVSAKQRYIKNRSGRQFMHYPEDLLIPFGVRHASSPVLSTPVVGGL